MWSRASTAKRSARPISIAPSRRSRRATAARCPPQQRDRILRGVLDQIVAYKLLMQESRARKIAVADAEVDARMKEIQGQFPSEDAFKQMLTVAQDDARTGARRTSGRTSPCRS